MCQVIKKDCCRAFAVQSDSASCCGSCGEVLLRCPGFDMCQGLLNADGYCEQCMTPKLALLDAIEQDIPRGATTRFRMELANESPALLPFKVEAAKIRIGGGPWIEVELAFEVVSPGTPKTFQITTPALDQTGRQGIELMFQLAIHRDWRKEEMVFVANFDINVDEAKETIVQQNIHCSGNEHQSGNTIYAPVRIVNDLQQRVADQPHLQKELDLIRSRKYEKQFGVLKQGQPLVSPNTEVEFVGFPQATVPHRQKIGVNGSLLQFGRSRSKAQGGPNDVRIIVFDAKGQIDEPSSLSISRTHFSVWLEGGQLMVRAQSPQGMKVDGKTIANLRSAPLGHQSKIQVLSGNKSIFEIEVQMESLHDQVETIKFLKR